MKKMLFLVTFFSSFSMGLSQVPGLELVRDYLSYPADSAIYFVNQSSNVLVIDSMRIKNPAYSAFGFYLRRVSDNTLLEVELHPLYAPSSPINLEISPNDTMAISIRGIDFCIACKVTDWVFIDTFQVFSGGMSAEFELKTNQVGVDDEISGPSNLRIKSNYPNPFNPSTLISIESSTFLTGELLVYDMLGRVVYESGEFSLIKGINEYSLTLDGNTSGQYLVIIKSGSYLSKKLITLLK